MYYNILIKLILRRTFEGFDPICDTLSIGLCPEALSDLWRCRRCRYLSLFEFIGIYDFLGFCHLYSTFFLKNFSSYDISLTTQSSIKLC